MRREDVAAAIAKTGQSAELRRYSGTGLGRSFVSVVLKGVVRRAQSSDIAGQQRQILRSVRISYHEIEAAGWAGAPRADDRLLIDGVEHTVIAVETLRIGDLPAAYILEVKG